MPPIVQEIAGQHSPESLVARLAPTQRGVVLLRSAMFEVAQSRYSFVTADPFLTFRSSGSRCEISPGGEAGHEIQIQFGNPWHLLDSLLARYELLDQVDLPFPLGGCFGYWGYELKNFVEPRLRRRAVNDLDLPECHVGFYDSLVVFDHLLGTTWIVSTGLGFDGSRSSAKAQERFGFWRELLERPDPGPGSESRLQPAAARECLGAQLHKEARNSRSSSLRVEAQAEVGDPHGSSLRSNLSRAAFVAKVCRAQDYIRAGDIYQVNLSHRLTAPLTGSGWDLFQRLTSVSPAPFAAYLDCDDFQIASSSPEQFLQLSGSLIRTRPIKGTRPRSTDATRDAQLAYELQTSAKEISELVMITDLLRNDLGRVCEFGSIQVPDLARLERFAHVQHLVSTVEGRLRPGMTHFAAFASCFPGGSITGAPKIRAMEIIDELEPNSRGPYTGALGYLGFNRESQLSIIIRAAVCKDGVAHFNVGAGIVADSSPEAEYEETLAKAQGFLCALRVSPERTGSLRPTEMGRIPGQAN